jgi:hypothetical protein
VTLTAHQAGPALSVSGEEAVRLWRAARRQAQPAIFPGYLDGLVEPFVRAVGAALAAGGVPEDVWGALEGIARFPPEGARPVHEVEWIIAGELVAAVADALKAEPEARHFAVAAARACWEATRALAEAKGPSRRRVLTVWVLAGGLARR